MNSCDAKLERHPKTIRILRPAHILQFDYLCDLAGLLPCLMAVVVRRWTMKTPLKYLLSENMLGVEFSSRSLLVVDLL